jgi:hypothetical protein
MAIAFTINLSKEVLSDDVCRQCGLVPIGELDFATIVDGKPGEDVAMKPFTRQLQSLHPYT